MVSIRLVVYPATSSPAVAVTLQLLHGPTFATIWMAGVAYVSEIAPPGLENTAQGIFIGIVKGLGGALGAFIGGFLFQSVGFSKMFLYAGIAVMLAFFTSCIGCRLDLNILKMTEKY